MKRDLEEALARPVLPVAPPGWRPSIGERCIVVEVHHQLFSNELGTDVEVMRFCSDPAWVWVSPNKLICTYRNRRGRLIEERATWQTPKPITSLAPCSALPPPIPSGQGAHKEP